MNEPHVKPPAADVRSFLPWAGEPVEDYAARLRALHHDLSLVLDAVERGLAAAAAEAPPRAPAPPPAGVVPEPYEIVAEPRRSPPPPAPPAAPRGGARVEVISTPVTARGEEGAGRAWSGPPEPEGSAPFAGRRAPVGEGAAPGLGAPAAPSPERSTYEEAPVERHAPWQEPVRQEPVRQEPVRQEPPPLTERRPSAWPPPPPPPAEMSFEAHNGPRRRVPPISPVVIAAALLGWLTAVALALVLALGL